MKANELRIGNYVEGEQAYVYQWELSDFVDWYNDHNSHIYGDSVKPIPLTEEWLLRFGFNDKEYKTGFIGINVNHTNFVLTKPGGKYDFKHYSWEFKNDIWPKYNEFEYVHQLQNFYFCLTGEELTVK